MTGSFSSGANAASAGGSAHGTFVSLGDGAKDNILAGYVHTVTRYSSVSQRSVYETGIYKVSLELELGLGSPTWLICLPPLTNLDRSLT